MRAEYIIIHHSKTKEGRVVDTQAIRRYHMSWKYNNRSITEEEARQLISQGIKGVMAPWRDIGYHCVLEKINDRYEALLGRMFHERGAHCRQEQMNSKSWGVCFVGDFDSDSPCDEQWNLGLKVVKALMIFGKIPKENVKGHFEYADYKSCPGKAFQIDKFRNML